MSDTEIIEPFGVPEFYVDGFGEHQVHGHNMTALGFRITKAGRVAVVKLTFPASSAQAAIEEAELALARDAPMGLAAATASKLPS